MKKAIAFSYLNAFNEIPRALDPWQKYGKIDYFICIDGRYKTPLSPKMYEELQGKSNYSTDGSEHLLKTRYGEKVIHERLYANQIEKRQRCFDIAAELGCEYVIVWDADDYIHPEYQNWGTFHKQFDLLAKHWKKEWIYKMYAWTPDAKTWPKQFNKTADNSWQVYDRIHRHPGSQKYMQTHWTFTKKDVTHGHINNWKFQHYGELDGVSDNPYFIKSHLILDGIRFTTDRTLRDQQALDWGNSWVYQNMHWETHEFNFKPLAHYGKMKTFHEDLPYYYERRDHNGEIQDTHIPYHINEKGNYVIINPNGKEEEIVILKPQSDIVATTAL